MVNACSSSFPHNQQVMQIQSDRQAMYAVKESHSKSKVKTWIANGRHMYPSSELNQIPQASDKTYTHFRDHNPSHLRMELQSISGTCVHCSIMTRLYRTSHQDVELVEPSAHPIKDKQSTNVTNLQSLPFDESAMEMATYLSTLSPDVWTTIFSPSPSPTKTDICMTGECHRYLTSSTSRFNEDKMFHTPTTACPHKTWTAVWQ